MEQIQHGVGNIPQRFCYILTWRHHIVAADLSAAHHDTNLPFHHTPKGSLLDCDQYSKLAIMFKKPVDLSLVTWCIMLLEAAIRRWVHSGYKGMEMATISTQVSSIGSNGSKVYQSKYPPHHYTITTSLTQWFMASWIHAYMLTTVLYSNSFKSPFFSILMLTLNFSNWILSPCCLVIT